MDSQILDLERALANLKADVRVLEQTVDSLKKSQDNLSEKIDHSDQTFTDLRINLNTDFSRVNYDIDRLSNEVSTLNQDLATLTSCTHSIDEKVDSLSKNGLLHLTTDLDIKKIITIVLILTSFISSPTLLTNWLSNQDNTSAERIERLITILESENVP